MEMTVYRIIIWGAGKTAREVLKYISDSVEVIGFLDNNPDINRSSRYIILSTM